jgi:hypothetical protein
MEGKFNFPGDNIEVVSAPLETMLMLHELQTIAEKAKAGKISNDEALEQASKVAPAFGRYLHFLASMGVPILTIILPLIALYLQFADSQSSDEFQAEALKLMSRQTEIMELLQQREDIQYNERIYNEGAKPADAETPPQTVVPQPRPDRRAMVNAERRAEIKRKRLAFGGSRRHGTKATPSQ